MILYLKKWRIMKKSEIAKHASRYLKVVEWSDEDRCFVGSAPPLAGRCCHGSTETAVMKQLCVVVDDLIAMMHRHGDPLPAATAGRRYSGKFVVRVPPELHQKAALKAFARGESLNAFVAEALAQA
jgi:predicted HicB family RNase H-like nuclease